MLSPFGLSLVVANIPLRSCQAATGDSCQAVLCPDPFPGEVGELNFNLF